MRRGLIVVLVLGAVVGCVAPASAQVPTWVVGSAVKLTFGDANVPGLGLEVPTPAVAEACPDDPDDPGPPAGANGYGRKCAAGPVVCTAYVTSAVPHTVTGDACTVAAGDVALTCARHVDYFYGEGDDARDCTLSGAGTTVSLRCETVDGRASGGWGCAVWPAEVSEHHTSDYGAAVHVRLGSVRYSCVSDDPTYELAEECSLD
jgi:hypothetical protein